MLSAVAARKARLAQSNSATPTDTPRQSPPPANAKGSAKPPSKRKPSAQTAAPQSKRRKVAKPRKQEKKRDKQGRYFASETHDQEDVFKGQEDVIVIEDDEDEEDESDEAELTPLSSADEGGHPQSRPQLEGSRQKRVWSPSRPLRDSSDEEDEGEDEDEYNFAQGHVREVDEPDLPGPSPRTPAPSPVLLSTYRPVSDQNFFEATEDELQSLGLSSNTPARILALTPTDRLALIGTYLLTVLHGTITISGVTLTPSTVSHRVYAPRSAPLPVIACLASLSPAHPLQLTGRLRELADRADALVVLQELKTGVEGLGRVCKTFEGVFEPSAWQKARFNEDLGLSDVHYATYETSDCRPFAVPTSWKAAISDVMPSEGPEGMDDLSRRVFLVRGAKKTGKSTFARTLLNNLTTRYRKVAFLECDLGQSEFTPGGMVALNIVSSPMFGPPFTHQSVPYRAHFIGATSPRNSPSHYLEAIDALLQAYNVDIQHALYEYDDTDRDATDQRIADIIPLVVNLMGWTKGLGGDLCRKIEDSVEPSAIFHFDQSTPDEGGPPVASTATAFRNAMDVPETKTFVLEPIPPAQMSTRFTPADHRVLSTLSYFHAVIPSPATSRDTLRSHYAASWNTALPLCAQMPLELDPEEALDAVVLLGPGAEDVVPGEITRVLNGAIVALVGCEPGAVEAGEPAQRKPFGIPYAQGTPAPTPSMSTCVGLALVRAVIPPSSSSLSSGTDTEQTRLQILTPLAPHHLTSPADDDTAPAPRVLVKGEMELPVWGMLDFRSGRNGAVAGVERGSVPYLRWGKGDGVGGERRRVRRNLMRRGQM